MDISPGTQGPKVKTKTFLNENEQRKQSDLVCAHKNMRKSSSVHVHLLMVVLRTRGRKSVVSLRTAKDK